MVDGVELFAGPGGWHVAAEMVGLTIGDALEHDDAAIATRQAAGAPATKADVSKADPRDYAGAPLLIASPPCPTFSQAGRGSGLTELDLLGAHVERVRRAGGWVDHDPSDYADERTPLILEVLRWVDAVRPAMIALEQVRGALEVWQHYADLLRGWGYAAAVGILNAADYGVPQTRRRAYLVASTAGAVALPEPTHAQDPGPASLFASRRPWVTGAAALGWDLETVRSRTRQTGAYVPTMAGGLPVDSWLAYRPATTIAAGDHRLPPPAYRKPGQSQWTGAGVVEISVEEAGVLQTFPADYPWQGGKGKRGEQVGNAVAPLMAAHVLAALTGRPAPTI